MAYGMRRAIGQYLSNIAQQRYQDSNEPRKRNNLRESPLLVAEYPRRQYRAARSRRVARYARRQILVYLERDDVRDEPEQYNADPVEVPRV
eukprot:742761-Rhodomonas_salina.3